MHHLDDVTTKHLCYWSEAYVDVDYGKHLCCKYLTQRFFYGKISTCVIPYPIKKIVPHRCYVIPQGILVNHIGLILKDVEGRV